MKINIIGNGAFGSFLNELLAPHFEITESAQSVILAVPIFAYEEVGEKWASKGKHLINVCSVQKPSMDKLFRFTDNVTGIHPLFGRRTPVDKRNTIITHLCNTDNDTWTPTCPEENDFLNHFSIVSKLILHNGKDIFTPESHDILMAKTHLAAAMAAQQMKVVVDRAKNIPDEFIPNSFRLLRDFVKTLDDMPQGTMESILANPYG